ncbi:hypothetical protein J6590_056223 [Homalodisca vitripennis]|nr:hypothetical protein J6590_056223 [Homalodisca vitripennis]
MVLMYRSQVIPPKCTLDMYNIVLLIEPSEMGCGYESEGENYECTLGPELQMTAQTELREDDITRRQALTQMRQWIDMHPDIHNCRKDAPFLLRFLRTKKFYLPLAQEMLEKYLTVRELYPHWFQKLDVLDPAIQDILDSGICPQQIPKANKQSMPMIPNNTDKLPPISAKLRDKNESIEEFLNKNLVNKITTPDQNQSRKNQLSSDNKTLDQSTTGRIGQTLSKKLHTQAILGRISQTLTKKLHTYTITRRISLTPTKKLSSTDYDSDSSNIAG